jgi:tRNA(adenine34) deaminase
LQIAIREMENRFDEWMLLALTEAEKAGQEGEVPVGAVLADGTGRVIAADHNRSVQRHDPTGHAEMNALRRGAGAAGNYRLVGTTLVVTIEPCLMCMGALVHARVARVVS